MRRFLSWIVLYIMNFLFYVAEFYIWQIAVRIGIKLIDSSMVVFLIVLFLGGIELLFGLLYVSITYGGMLVIKASQGTWRSVNGTRYKVMGIINILTHVLYIIVTFVLKTASGPNLVVSILAYITMAIFGIAMISMRKSIVYEYGQPPTKREILQAKLDKLDGKYCKNCGAKIIAGSSFCNNCGERLN